MANDECKKFIETAKEISDICYDRDTCIGCPFSWNDGTSRCVFNGYPWEWSLDMTEEES